MLFVAGIQKGIGFVEYGDTWFSESSRKRAYRDIKEMGKGLGAARPPPLFTTVFENIKRRTNPLRDGFPFLYIVLYGSKKCYL